MPSWAPESWVDSDRSPARTPMAPRSPAAARCSTGPRSTVTRLNSAATNSPQATASTTATPRRTHSISGHLRRGGGGGARGWTTDRA